jgi:type IV pilus assembly protein PilC
MPFIVYSCITATGGLEWRNGNYDSLEALYTDLHKRGERIDRFLEFPDLTNRLLETLRGKLSANQVVEFCNYLSLYVQGGLDLQTALADLARGAGDGTLRKAAEHIRRDLFNGLSLSQAMDRSGQFPEVVIAMTRIGESSGNLDQMLADASAYIERIREIRSATLRAMIYPAFSMLMLLLTAAFWMAFLVPKLAAVYKTMDIELPLATRALIGLSEFLTSGWIWVLLAAVLLPLIYTMARRHQGLRQTFDRISWNLPIFGNVVRNAQEAFFFQYLAMVYRAGVPITEAVTSLIETTQNRYFRNCIRRVPEHLRLGLSLREAFERCNIFQPLDIRMIAIGEQTGALETQLIKLASLYMQRVRVAVEMLTKAIEPLLILVMGALFALFVVAMLGPIYGLVTQLMSSMSAQ